MEIIDLTQRIRPAMPVFPGDAAPQFEQTACVEQDGCNMMQITMNCHAGTHVDAPRHMLQGGATIDQLPLTRFCGLGMTLDCRALGDHQCVTVASMQPYAQAIQQTDYLLFDTGWSRHWGAAKYYEPFPTLDEAAARWLLQFQLKGVGVDALSIDRLDALTSPIHRLLLSAGVLIVENLTGLRQLRGRSFTFYCLPLKVEGADGSPVRAIAVL